jgi:prepilin-type processing-associated H-X9-DG protein
MNPMNATVYTARIGQFLCPSDQRWPDGGSNYRGNAGVGPVFHMSAEAPDSGNGLFPEVGLVTPGFVPDGLSQTAAFSERVIGAGREWPLRPDRDVFAQMPWAFTADEVLRACRISARPESMGGFPWSGRWWFWTGRERTLYAHAQPPNGRIPDCMYRSGIPSQGMVTARSRHPGGVNVVMGDGSVRFVTDGTAPAIWRALGSRNGRDISE